MVLRDMQLTLPVSEPSLWWQHGVIYQVYVRSFQDSNADGIGDLAGVIQRLDYLGGVLGVDALWLTPFYPSPMADGGYDVADYQDVDPLFGDLEIFQRLLREAHARGLRVIVDYVPNHTSDQHPWFVESRSSQSNPRKDWYIWADARPNGGPPNNWLSVFGGSAWTWDNTRQQYYLHSFLSEQPDLNWRHPEVKEAMFSVLRFWLDLGVDGLRIDVAHFLMKDPYLRDNPPNPSGAPAFWRSFGPYDSQIHLFDQGHPDVHQLHRDIRHLLDSYGEEQPRVSIGELHRPDIGSWAAHYGRDLDELHLPFNFRLMMVPWTALSIRRVVDEVEASIPSGAWPNYVLGNHDEPRVASRIGPAQARIAMMLLLTLRGTPTLYYGDELGMQNTSIPLERVRDRWENTMPGLSLGRDQERTPMVWDTSLHAGFCSPDVEPWLPISEREKMGSVLEQLIDPVSILTLTRRLLSVRQAHPALSRGTYRALPMNHDDGCFVYLREHDDQCFLIALNLTNIERQLDLGVSVICHILLSTYLDREEEINLTHLTLRADEGCLIALDIGDGL